MNVSDAYRRRADIDADEINWRDNRAQILEQERQDRIGDGRTVTVDQFKAMGYADRVHLLGQNPDRYAQLLKEASR